jgi:acyl-CoA thioester hydrolase
MTSLPACPVYVAVQHKTNDTGKPVALQAFCEKNVAVQQNNSNRLLRMSETTDKAPAKAIPTRADYAVLRHITTRWSDNDVYGHVNNVVYYSWFDTAVNAYLIEQGALDIHAGSTIGLVVETHCNYYAPLAFPQTIEAGIRVGRIGNSSVRYEIALFAENSLDAAANGHFVHVYVDKITRRPTALPANLKQALQKLSLEN